MNDNLIKFKKHTICSHYLWFPFVSLPSNLIGNLYTSQNLIHIFGSFKYLNKKKEKKIRPEGRDEENRNIQLTSSHAFVMSVE